MPSKTITVTNGDGSTKTITIPDRSRFAGTRTMSRVTGGVADNITVDRTAQVVTSDRKGESRPLLTKVVGGASAAYSLRDLNDRAGNNKVVRVRRASDNTEKDFRAKEVKDIATWANAQVVPPLDIRELDSNGERTGDLVEAAAAYSLRNLSSTYTGDVVEVRRNTDGATQDFNATEVSDGTLTDWVNTSFADALPLDTATGAAAAYSLRNLSSSYTGNVVDVRRSSDDAEDSFTAAEVADGTLTDWVNEAVTAYTQTGELSIPTSSGALYTLPSYSVPNATGKRYRVTFELKLNSGGAGTVGSNPRLRTPSTWVYSNYTHSSNLTPNTHRFEVNQATEEYQTYTVTFTTDTGSSISPLRFQTYDNNDSYTVRNFTTELIGQDGFVTQWYDQSGNANHATQGTDASQPKIVDAGSLVTGGLDFDGINDELKAASFSASQPITSFSVFTQDSTSSTIYGSGGGHALITSSTNKISLNAGTALVSSAPISLGTQALVSALANSTSSFTYINGGNTTTGDAGTTAIASPLKLGNIQSGRFTDGKLQEIIIYNSDQSDKRRAIEENIGDHYGITLASFSNDGFVSRWYDQSGNGNHANQTNAASRPKIVDAGSLLNKLKFEGAQFLQREFTSPLSQPNSSFVVAQMDASTGNTKIFDGFGGSNRNLMFATNGSDFAMYAGSTVKYADRDANENLHTAIFNEDSSLGALNGVVTPISGMGSQAAGGITIGRTHNVATNFLTGTVSELIFYNSDQSDNRTAIEANIGETYGIDLPSGVDTGYDQVDGFVETWYDQSGNGNDAVQETAGSQPKIVDAGVFLGEVDFDGVNDYLQTTNSDLCNVAELSVFSVLKPHIAPSQVVAFSCGSVVAGSTGYGGWLLNLNGYLDRTQFKTQAVGSVNTTSVDNTVGGNDTLVSYVADFPDSSSFANGQAGSSSSSTVSPNNGNSFRRQFRIGCRYTYTLASFYTQPIKEIIIYDTDQSANRVAIEANINNQYDIY